MQVHRLYPRHTEQKENKTPNNPNPWVAWQLQVFAQALQVTQVRAEIWELLVYRWTPE